MMVFASEKQRRYVMSLMDKVKEHASCIKEKSSSPLSFDSKCDSKEYHCSEYDKMMDKFEDEYRKVQDDADKDIDRSMSNFSEKRGSVPLLPNTYVIRGSNPKQRQKVKRALDMVGDELPMKNINTVMITPDQDLPLILLDEKTVSLSERFLSGSDGEIAKTILSSVYRRVHPEAQDGAEFAFAAEVVEPKVRERTRRELEERKLNDLDVHQVGVQVQPEFDVAPKEGDSGGFEIKLVPPVVEALVENPPLGVPTTDSKEYDRIIKERMEGSIYNGGVK